MLDDLKIMLGIPAENTTLDKQLELIQRMTEQRLAALLGAPSVPVVLDWIVTEVSVQRFNRIGSEGMKSHTVEGEVLEYSSGDFDPYQAEIAAWREQQKENQRGKVRFL